MTEGTPEKVEFAKESVMNLLSAMNLALGDFWAANDTLPGEVVCGAATQAWLTFPWTWLSPSNNQELLPEVMRLEGQKFLAMKAAKASLVDEAFNNNQE